MKQIVTSFYLCACAVEQTILKKGYAFQILCETIENKVNKIIVRSV